LQPKYKFSSLTYYRSWLLKDDCFNEKWTTGYKVLLHFFVWNLTFLSVLRA
jgi:protein AbiQ